MTATDANGVSINLNALTTPVGSTIRNAANTDADLTHGAVFQDTAHAVDTAAPTLNTATVNGDSMVLTYSEDLDTTSTPANTDYTIAVSGSGTPPTVTGTTISGTMATLTLSTAVTQGVTVTVSYTPGTTPLQDIAGNDAARLTPTSVTNDTPAPPDPTATLAGTVTEASLLAGTATVTVMLENTEYVARGILMQSDFSVTDTVAGTVSVSDFTRDSNTEATLTLEHTGEAIPDSGTLSVTVLASAHTGTDELPGRQYAADYGGQHRPGFRLGNRRRPDLHRGHEYQHRHTAAGHRRQRRVDLCPRSGPAERSDLYRRRPHPHRHPGGGHRAGRHRLHLHGSDSDTNTATTDAVVLMFTIQIAASPVMVDLNANIAGDDVVNIAERAGGFDITGTVEALATVNVTLGSSSTVRPATVTGTTWVVAHTGQ